MKGEDAGEGIRSRGTDTSQTVGVEIESAWHEMEPRGCQRGVGEKIGWEEEWDGVKSAGRGR